MDKDTMELLVREVMKRLESLEGDETSSEKEAPLQFRKRIACIRFSPEQVEMAKAMAPDVEFIFRDKIYQKMDVSEVWVARIDDQDLANMAFGFNPQFGFVMEQIMKGSAIFLFPEGRSYYNYKETTPPFLWKMWESYEKKIFNMGVSFENPLLQGPSYFEKETPSFFQGSEVVFGSEGLKGKMCVKHRMEKRLITEGDMKDMPKNTCVLEVPKHAIVTALADDYLRQKDITLVRF